MIAKAAVTSNEMTLTGGGSNIATDIGELKIYMSENKFKEIYETPTLYGFFFDVEGTVSAGYGELSDAGHRCFL